MLQYLHFYQRTVQICFKSARLCSLLLLRIPSYERGHLTYLHFQIDRLVANTSKQFIDMKSFYAINASCVGWFIQGVSGGIVNILGGGNTDYSE